MNKYQEAIRFLANVLSLFIGKEPAKSLIQEKFKPLEELVDKATPKKPKFVVRKPSRVHPYDKSAYYCSMCGKRIDDSVSSYCAYCGQKLDWGD